MGLSFMFQIEDVWEGYAPNADLIANESTDHFNARLTGQNEAHVFEYCHYF